ncbi:hypothetical protein [Kocuria marina]|uniref:hypothetical protein n=1 Tax=Kocuria marina TaxID=223184 RepID=UPI0022DF6A0D|nr:hypothetical protein [Kocuria marina]
MTSGPETQGKTQGRWRMRWDDLFEDMEAQLEQARLRLVEQEAVETARAELSRLTLLERLAAHRGGPVRLRPARGDTLEGELADVGSGWVVVRERHLQHLVPLHSVVWWEGLPRRFEVLPERSTIRRLGMGHVLRALSTARVHVRVVLQDDSGHGEIEGTVDTVGQDFFDVAVHPQDQFRRRRSVTAVRTVGFHAVALVSSLDAG